MALVYLAGPIDGIEGEDDWRTPFAARLHAGSAGHIGCYNPRGAFLVWPSSGPHELYAKQVSAINRAAIKESDWLLAYLPSEMKQKDIYTVKPFIGFGTVREIEYARSLGKPVVVVGKIVSLEAHDLYLLPDLDQAYSFIKDRVMAVKIRIKDLP